jgi:hypothetical protein
MVLDHGMITYHIHTTHIPYDIPHTYKIVGTCLSHEPLLGLVTY